MGRWLLLICALTLVSCSRPGAGRIDPALASLVPPDSVVLAGIQVDKLRTAPLYQKHADLFSGGVRQAGLDERDLYQILLVSDAKRTAILARGHFSPADGSEPRIHLPGAVPETYKGYKVQIAGDEALAFMNPSTAAMGSPDAVHWIIDQRGVASGIPASLAAKLGKVPLDHQIWAVGVNVGNLRGPEGSPMAVNLWHALAMTESVVVALQARDGLSGFADFTCRNPRDATDLAGAASVMLGLLRLPREAIQVTQQEQTVRIAIALSAAEIDEFGR